MIPKLTIEAYLKRPLKDWSWYKNLTDAKLAVRRDGLIEDPPIWRRLHRHQKIGFLFGVRLKRACFWYDTGTGKSLLSLALIRYFHKRGKLGRALVLVPNKVNKAEWAREITKHSPRTEYEILKGTSAEKWAALQATRALIVIETYAGFIRMMSSPQKVGRRKKRKLVPDAARVAEASKLLDMLLLDESGGVGNHLSLTYRICKKLSENFPYVFALNGTPFGRDPTPLWAQMFVVDRGETLGKTLGLFRAAFFSEYINFWGGAEYTFKKREAHKLNRMIANRSLRYTADESDLPQVVRIKKHFDLEGQAEVYYKKALENLRKAWKGRNTRAIKNEFMRLRQLSSGYLGYKDEDEGKSAQLAFDETPKLDLCLSLLESIVTDHKAVVFHEFTFSGTAICRELTKMGIGCARIYGGTKDTEAELRRFTNDEDCRVLALNNHAGGLGLNLQVARYGLYYESPVSARMRKQTEARIWRQGSDHSKVILYDLVMAHGVDEKILAFHAQGKSLLDAILDGSETV